MDERPAGARGDGVAGRVEDVEVELDELGRVLRGPRILGEHERDRLADVAHDLPREDGLEHPLALGRRREREPDRDAHVGDVRRRQDGEHAAVLARRLGRDAEQRRVGDRAADDTCPHLPGQIEVGDVAPASGEELEVARAGRARPDRAAHPAASLRNRASTSRTSRATSARR